MVPALALFGPSFELGFGDSVLELKVSGSISLPRVVAAAVMAGGAVYFLTRSAPAPAPIAAKTAPPVAASKSTPGSAPACPRTGSHPDDFKDWGKAVIDWVVKYRSECNELPVRSKVEPGYLRALLPDQLPEHAEPWEDIMMDLDRTIVPGLTNWEANRRFFAYFKPHSSYPAVLGETLCAGLNVMGFDWIASPACTELECVTLDWLGRFLNIPETFLPFGPGPGGAVIQGSAGEATIVSILGAVAAHEKKLGGTAVDRRTLVVYCSDQTHAVAQKACMILGIQELRKVKTTAVTGWALTGPALAAAVQKDLSRGELLPIAAIATVGTTTSCAFDNLESIGKECRRLGLWLHVDGAYGGAYSCLPELTELFAGLQYADSYCVNCHKKLLCPFDICALFLADRNPILAALSLQPEYLRNAASDSGAVIDFEHWQMPLGRRFRALKLWFVLRRYGANEIRDHLRNGIRLREVFESKVLAHERLEIAAPPSLSLCCFRLKDLSDDAQRAFLDELNRVGEVFLIHSSLGERIVLRFACGGMEQTEADIEFAWLHIQKSLDSFEPAESEDEPVIVDPFAGFTFDRVGTLGVGATNPNNK